MRKLVSLSLAMCFMLCTVNKAMAYDFSAVNNGQTIYYNITSSTVPLTVEVTYDVKNSSSNYIGAVIIPDTVTDNGNTYSVTAIGDFAFSTCSGLTSVTIPNAVITIGDYAFSDCSDLISITIPNAVTAIGSYAFSHCTGLKSVTIPSLVTTIGSSAFWNCNALTEIISLAVNPPDLVGYNVFFNVPTGIPVYVPCGSAGAYKSATKWSIFSNINIIDTINISPNHLALYSNNTVMGVVTVIQPNTCANDTAIIEAIANASYRFVQWNDGNTTNPRTITVTQDTTFTAEFEIETGITRHNDVLHLKIYPNPAKDAISIVLPENTTLANFILYDIQGRKLLQQNLNGDNTVSIIHLSSGIYIYTIVIDGKRTTGKIVKG